MQEATSLVAALPLPMFPAGVDTRWETTNCVVWNDRERIAEKTRDHLRGCLDSRVGYLATVPEIAAQTA
jgi:hypothetical protein